MARYRIVLVGAGQIGSRHLQGLRTITEEIEVAVVDPSRAALEQARARLLEGVAAEPFRVRFLTTLAELPARADIAIVATSADTRRAAVEGLLAACDLPYLLLEKVLFQREEDYAPVATLLCARGVTAWVNCPRRRWPCFRALGSAVAGGGRIEMVVDGAQFGLACNSVHFLDLFEAFGGGLEEILTDGVDRPLLEAKRKGFVEMTGRLEGRGRHGWITLVSRPAGDSPLLVSVASDRARGVVEQVADRVSGRLEARWRLARAEEDWSWREGSETVAAQSAVTGAVVAEILAKGRSDLTSYDESMRVHLPLVRGMTALYRQVTGSSEASCPIT